MALFHRRSKEIPVMLLITLAFVDILARVSLSLGGHAECVELEAAGIFGPYGVWASATGVGCRLRLRGRAVLRRHMFQWSTATEEQNTSTCLSDAEDPRGERVVEVRRERANTQSVHPETWSRRPHTVWVKD
jgi:hypothetical protein